LNPDFSCDRSYGKTGRGKEKMKLKKITRTNFLEKSLKAAGAT
jgi:hypothetical protein